MADTALSFFTASRRPMKCTICAQTARPGTKLCSQCRAALKRARNETVSQLEPLPRSSRALATDRAAAKQRARERLKARSLAQNPNARPKVARDPSLRRVGVALVVFGVLVAAAGHFEPWWTRAGGSSSPEAAAFVPKAAEAPVVSTSTVALTQSAGSEQASLAPPPQDGPPDQVAPPKRTFVARSLRPLPPSLPIEPAVVPVPAVEATLPAPVPVSPPVPREIPPPDRWQVLSDSIARCAREDFIGRVVCEQRARLRACDGYWGQVAQCPAGISNDHGQ